MVLKNLAKSAAKKLSQTVQQPSSVHRVKSSALISLLPQEQ